MRTSIGIKMVGNKNVVYLADFIEAGDKFLRLLSEVDSSISATAEPTIEWRLKSLKYASPLELMTEPETKEDEPDNRSLVIDTIFEGIEFLKQGSKRPRGFSDKALTLTRDLAGFLRDGVDRLEIISDNGGVSYEPRIFDNVDLILKPKREVVGSLEGKLERMNSHGVFNFWVYEPILSRRIRCEMKDAANTKLKNEIIGLYEKLVMVSGLLTTNINGEVIEAKVDSISEREMASLLKNASEVTGIWDLTGGVDPVEHIRRMRE